MWYATMDSGVAVRLQRGSEGVRYGQVGHTNIAARIEDHVGEYLRTTGTVVAPVTSAGFLAFTRDYSEHESRGRVMHTAMVTANFVGIGETATAARDGLVEYDAARKTYRGMYNVMATYFMPYGVILAGETGHGKAITLTVSGACSVMNTGTDTLRCGERVYFLFPDESDDFAMRKRCVRLQETAAVAIIVGERTFEAWVKSRKTSKHMPWHMHAYHFVGVALTNATSGTFVHVLLKD